MMKRFNVILMSALLSFGLVACHDNVEHAVKGVIVDASMNTLTVIDSAGDTVTFSTMDADRSEAHGLLLGDTAVVSYTGKLNMVPAGDITPATKVVVIPIARASDKLVGTWVEPVPGMKDQVQGVKIDPSGIAGSVNMATLVYNGWSSWGSNAVNNADTLVLTGESIGNGQTIRFADTARVETLTADSLVLVYGDRVVKYSRQR